MPTIVTPTPDSNVALTAENKAGTNPDESDRYGKVTVTLRRSDTDFDKGYAFILPWNPWAAHPQDIIDTFEDPGTGATLKEGVEEGDFDSNGEVELTVHGAIHGTALNPCAQNLIVAWERDGSDPTGPPSISRFFGYV